MSNQKTRFDGINRSRKPEQFHGIRERSKVESVQMPQQRGIHGRAYSAHHDELTVTPLSHFALST